MHQEKSLGDMFTGDSFSEEVQAEESILQSAPLIKEQTWSFKCGFGDVGTNFFPLKCVKQTYIPKNLLLRGVDLNYSGNIR
jgi:hypothetical protein